MVKKFSELPVFEAPPELYHVHWLQSYRYDNGIPVTASTVLYAVHHLPRLNDGNPLSSEKIFAEDDIIVLPAVNATPILKIGALYIEFKNGGLSFYSIDRERKKLHPFLNLGNPGLRLEYLLPFDTAHFFPHRVMMREEDTELLKQKKSEAYELKTLLIRLSQGNTLSEDEKKKFQRHYLALCFPTLKNDPDFMVYLEHFNPNQPTKTLVEVSKKIAGLLLTNLSISEEDITKIIHEYLQLNPGKKPNEAMRYIILDNSVAGEGAPALPLRVLACNIEPTLSEAIKRVMHPSRTPKEIDEIIQAKIPTNLNLKQRKQRYLEELDKIMSEFNPGQKQGLVFYVLNSPSHFLKQERHCFSFHFLSRERHFFRTQKYSNETFSVCRLVKMLMPDLKSESGKIVIEGGEGQADYTISRHVK